MYVHNRILLSIRKDEILPFATTWMYLESIMLSKIKKMETDKNYIISLHKWGIKHKTTNEENI